MASIFSHYNHLSSASTPDQALPEALKHASHFRDVALDDLENVLKDVERVHLARVIDRAIHSLQSSASGRNYITPPRMAGRHRRHADVEEGADALYHVLDTLRWTQVEVERAGRILTG